MVIINTCGADLLEFDDTENSFKPHNHIKMPQIRMVPGANYLENYKYMS